MDTQAIVDFEPVEAEAPEAEEKPKKSSQATLLVKIAEPAELFHDAEGEGYAKLAVNGHVECWPVKSRGFREWLLRQFWLRHKQSPSATALADALAVLQSIARFDGPERAVFLRVAEQGGTIYLDLCDSRWRCVEVTPSGWRILDQSPVPFIRHRKMLPLPTPNPGDHINELWRFLNVSGEERVLVTAWLLQALRPCGPYPLLCLQGEQGTAKTTASRLLRRLIDPSRADVRSPPKSEDDLFVSAARNHVIAFDNLSGIQPWLSDSLCRIATGGGINKRALFTNDEEHVVEALRPIVLNGIDDLATRQDLISRSIILNLSYIPEKQRQEESVFWQAFDEASPRILGALLDLLVKALGNLPQTHLEKLPRMADFAKWATAALGQEFIEVYEGNIEEAVEQGLEGSPVAHTLRLLMDGVQEWKGTSNELLRDLEHRTDIQTKMIKSWPKSGTGLTQQLKRLGAALRLIGLNVTFHRSGKVRSVIITKFEDKGKKLSQVSQNGKNPATAGAGGVTDWENKTVTYDTLSVTNDSSKTQKCHTQTQAAAGAGGPFTPQNDTYDTFSPYSSHVDLNSGGSASKTAKHSPPDKARNGGRKPCASCSGEGCHWCNDGEEAKI